MLNAAKVYLSTQVSTASKGDILVMLYDTAIKHLRQAIEKMRAGDMAGKGILITKAITIISELQESLNKEHGGEIAQNLFQLYFFCNSRLLMANLKVKPEMVEEVITILFGLRQAFSQILPQNGGVASVTQSGAGMTDASAAPAIDTATTAPAAAPVAASSASSAAASVVKTAATAAEVATALTVGARSYVSAAHAPAAGASQPEEKPEEQPHAAPRLNPLLAPPSAPAASPGASAQPETAAPRAPGLRLRAVNAYSTTR